MNDATSYLGPPPLPLGSALPPTTEGFPWYIHAPMSLLENEAFPVINIILLQILSVKSQLLRMVS